LTGLTFLDLRNNRLRVLPAGIGDLPHLEKLDLRWNQLAARPEWLPRLEQRGCLVYE
jgi:Leucine-rich repeat (LRR) protein